MAKEQPSFSIGIEEEYLLVDTDTFDLAVAPEALMKACEAELDDQVSPEFLQCQIEIGTHVCAGVSEAREDLRHLRSVVLLPVGYRKAEQDWLVNLPKVRRPREQFVTEVN